MRLLTLLPLFHSLQALALLESENLEPNTVAPTPIDPSSIYCKIKFWELIRSPKSIPDFDNIEFKLKETVNLADTVSNEEFAYLWGRERYHRNEFIKANLDEDYSRKKYIELELSVDSKVKCDEGGKLTIDQVVKNTSTS